MNEFRVASDVKYLIGESPRWDQKNNILWFVDLFDKKILQYDPKTNLVKTVATEKSIGGFSFNKIGGLICASDEGLFLWNEKDGFQLIASEFQGNKLQCNDAIADPRGRFLFGTTFYTGEDTNCTRGKLYIMDKDRSIRILDKDILHSNGLGFSPDGKRFYYTDLAKRHIYAYDYDLDSGTVSNKQIFIEVPRYEGAPDGLTVDAEGCVWSAHWYGGRVVRYDLNGNVDVVLRTPVMQPSAVAFGGEDMSELYVTSAARWAHLECVPQLYFYDSFIPGGELFCYKTGYKGKPADYANIK